MSKQVENHKLRHKIQKRGEAERTWATFMLPLFLLFPLFPLLLFPPLLLLLFRVSFIFILATLENVFEPYLSMYWFTVADTSRIRHRGSLPLSLSRCLSPSLCLTNHGQCALKTHSLRVAAGKCGGGALSLSLTRSAALPLDWLCIPLPSRRGGEPREPRVPREQHLLYTLCTWAGYFVKTSVFRRFLYPLTISLFPFSVILIISQLQINFSRPLALSPL